MSDNRELKLTVVVDDSRLQGFREQLEQWKKDFPKGADKLSGRVTGALEEIGQAAKATNSAVVGMADQQKASLKELTSALAGVARSMDSVEAAMSKFKGIGSAATQLKDSVKQVSEATGQLKTDMANMSDEVSKAIKALPTQVKGALGQVTKELKALNGQKVSVEAEVDFDQINALKSQIQELRNVQKLAKAESAQATKAVADGRSKLLSAQIEAKAAQDKTKTAFQKVVEAEMADDANLDKLSKQYDKAVAAADRAEKQVLELEQAQEALERQTKETADAITANASKIDQLENSLAKAAQGMKATGQASEDVGKATTEVSQLARAIENLTVRLSKDEPTTWAKEAAESFKKYFTQAAQSVNQLKQPLDTISALVASVDNRLDSLGRTNGVNTGISQIVDELRTLSRGFGLGSEETFKIDFTKAQADAERLTQQLGVLAKQREKALAAVDKAQSGVDQSKQYVGFAQSFIDNPKSSAKSRADAMAQLPIELEALAASEAKLASAQNKVDKLDKEFAELEAQIKQSAAAMQTAENQIAEAGLATVRLSGALQVAAQSANTFENSLDFSPILAALSKIDSSIAGLANTMAEQAALFGKAGKKAGDEFAENLEKEVKAGAAEASLAAQKILNARFLTKGSAAQITETLQAQLAAAQGVKPEVLNKKFSSFAVGDSINIQAYLGELDLQTKQLQEKVKQVMKAAVIAPYEYAGAEWWVKILAEKEKGIAEYFKSFNPDTSKLQTQVKGIIKAAVVAPYEYAGAEWWEGVLKEKEQGIAEYFASLDPDTKQLRAKVREVMKAAVVAPYQYAGAEWWDSVLKEKEKGIQAYFASLNPDTKQLQNRVKAVMKAATVAAYQPAGRTWWESVMAEQAAGAAKVVAQYDTIAKQAQAARDRMIKVLTSKEGGDAATFAMTNRGASLSDKFELQDMAEFYRSGQGGGAVKDLAGQTAELAKFDQAKKNSISSNAAFNKSLDDMKFAARGVASGFNAMWLTWGNIAPLFIGAAISNAFVQAAKQGAALKNELEFIAVLGGESAESIKLLETELLRLGTTGIFGPQQVAEAMKTMALAGVDAKTSALVMGDAVNLATVGALDLKTASESMVGIANAFGIPFAALGRVGDVIAKSAAVSQTSVQTITESMKTASVVAQRYGVSIEDTATALTVLGKINITGTAAGTAFRNMIVGLTGNSVQAKRALEILADKGFKPLKEDNTGNLKKLSTVIEDFVTVTSKLDAKSFEEVMKTITTERGDKAFSALQASMKKMVEVGGKELPELKFLLDEITNSYGFNAIAAARLATTTENEFKRVRAALQTSLVEAFNEAEPRLRAVAIELRRAFADPEFKQALADITVSLARFSLFLVENREILIKAGQAFLFYKAAMIGFGALGNITQVVTGFTGALRAKTAAAGVASAALNVTAASTVAVGAATAGSTVKMLASLGGIARFMGPLGAVVGLAATAWALYADKSAGAVDAAAEAASSKGQSIKQYLDDENIRLEKQLEILGRLKAEKKEVYSLNQVLGIQEATAELDEKERRVRKDAEDALRVNETRVANASSNNPKYLENLANVAAANRIKIEKKLNADLAAIKAEREKTETGILESARRNAELSKKVAETTEAMGLGGNKPRGTEELDPFTDFNNNYKNSLSQFDRLEEQSADRQKEILDAKLKYKLMSEESYLTALEEIKRKEQAALLESNDRQVMDVKASGLKGTELQKQLDLLAKRRQAVLDNIAADTFLANLKFEGERNIAALKLDTDLRKVSLKVTNDLAKAQAELNNTGLAPEIRAANEARLKVEQEFSRVLEQRLEQEEALQSDMEILLMQEGELDKVSYDRLIEKIGLTQQEIDKIKGVRDALAEQAAEEARIRELQKQQPIFGITKALGEYGAELNNLGKVAEDVTNKGLKALEDALVSGAEAGGEAFKRMFDDIEDQIKRLIVREIIMKPITVAIKAVIEGGNPLAGGNGQALAGSLGAFAAGQVGGSSGMLLNGLLSNSNQIASQIVSLGSVSGEASANLLQLGNNLGKIAPYAGSIAAIFEGNYASGLGSAAGVALATTFGQALGSFAGPIGSIVGGIVGEKLLGGLFGGGKISATGLDPAQLKPITDAVQTSYTELLKFLGGSGSATFGIGGNTGRQGQNPNFTLNASANGQRIFNSSQTPEGRADGLFLSGEIALNDANIADQTTRAIVAALKLSDFADNIDAVLASLDPFTDSLAELNAGLQDVQFLKAINDLGQAGGVMATLAGGSRELVASFLKLVGGIQGLQELSAGYIEAIYSDADKLDIAMGNLRSQFEILGLRVPRTTEEYRKLTEAQDLSTTRGQELYAALLALAPTFKQVTDQAEQLGLAFSVETFQEISDVFIDLLERIKGERLSISETRAEITGVPLDLTSPDQIRAQLAQVQAGLPENNVADLVAAQARVDTAQGDVGLLTQRLDSQNLEVASAQNRVNAADAQQEAAKIYAQKVLSIFNSSMRYGGAFFTAKGGAQASGSLDEATGLLKQNIDYITYFIGRESEVYALRDQLYRNDRTELDGLSAMEGFNKANADTRAASVEAQRAESLLNFWKGVADSTSGLLSGAEDELAAAEKALLDAQNTFAAQARKYAEEASAAVDQLSSLREATVAYYEAMKAREDDARALIEQAESDIADAEGRINDIREQATSNYLSAQERVAQAQEAVNDLLGQSATKMFELTKSLRDFLAQEAGSQLDPTQNFNNIAQGVLGGDFTRADQLLPAAQAALESINNTATSSLDAARQRAGVLNQVRSVADFSEASGGAAGDPLLVAQQELTAAQAELAEALRVANAINAPLVEGQNDLIAEYTSALTDLAKANQSLDDATALLNDILATNYAEESLSVLNLIDSSLAELQAVVAAGEFTVIDAIEQSGGQVVQGLRQVVNALVGNPVQAFATGASFTNGVATRPTFFNNSVMGEAGPEAILPLANIGGSLGVRAQTDPRVAALLEQLINETRMLRSETQATAANTAKTVRLLDDATDGGDALRTIQVTQQ